MAQRTWKAIADQPVVDGEGNEVGRIVSQESLAKAMVDAAIVLDRVGGCVFVAVKRQATGVPNEMLTSDAVVTWQDRAFPKDAPESADTGTGAGVPAAPPVTEAALAEPVPAAAGDGERPPQDYDPENPPEVDESDIPVEMRA